MSHAPAAAGVVARNNDRLIGWVSASGKVVQLAAYRCSKTLLPNQVTCPTTSCNKNYFSVRPLCLIVCLLVCLVIFLRCWP